MLTFTARLHSSPARPRKAASGGAGGARSLGALAASAASAGGDRDVRASAHRAAPVPLRPARRPHPARPPSLIEAWEARFGAYDAHAASEPDAQRLAAAWDAFGERMADHYPFFHPRYAGQMLKPPHPVAVAGYLAAMLVNPNNHALDGGPGASGARGRGGRPAARHVRPPLPRPRPPDLERDDRQPRGAVGRARGPSRQAHRAQLRRALHPRAHVRAARHHRHRRRARRPRPPRPRRRRGRVREGRRRDRRAHHRLDRPRRHRSRRRGARPARALRRAPARRRRLRRLLHAAGPRRGPARRARALRGDRAVRLGRRRSPQARPSALRLRRDPLRRPVGRARLPPRLALHLLHRGRAAPRRDQPRVLARGRGGRRAVADPPGAAARARRGPRRGPRGRAPRGARLGAAADALRRPRAARRARARHRHLPAARRARCRRSTPPAAPCSTPAWRIPRTRSSSARCTSGATRSSRAIPSSSPTPTARACCAACS